MTEQTALVSTAPPIVREKPTSFAHGMNFYKLFWVFFISCFAGVAIELLYCFATKGYFESRSGLVYGPFNLVYGFGGLCITIGLSWLAKKKDLYVFLGGVAIGSVVEYACSWVQQNIFGTVSWEYSDLPLNINGRISLLYSFFWGVLGLLWMKEVYPRLSQLIEKIPNKPGVILTWVLLAFMVFNTIMSGAASLRMEQRRNDIPATNVIQTFLDEHFPDERMEKIYVNTTVVDDKTPETPPSET